MNEIKHGRNQPGDSGYRFCSSCESSLLETCASRLACLVLRDYHAGGHADLFDDRRPGVAASQPTATARSRTLSENHATTMIWFAAINPVLSPASPQAQTLSNLFVVTLIVCAVIFSLIVAGLVVWCVMRFRQGDLAVEPRQSSNNTRLEVSWTLALILVLIFLFMLTIEPCAFRILPMDREAGYNRNRPSMVVGKRVMPTARSRPTKFIFRRRRTCWCALMQRTSFTVFGCRNWGAKWMRCPGHPNHLWIRADQAGQYLAHARLFVARNTPGCASWSWRNRRRSSASGTPSKRLA